MTAKEKAKQLYNKFNPHCLVKNFYGDDVEVASTKQSALIAVDEIIKVLVELSNGEFTFIHDVKYWREVKKEIEKL